MGLGSREFEPEGKQLPSLLVIDVEGPAAPVRALEHCIGQHLSCCPDCHLEGFFRPLQLATLFIRINPVPIP